MAAGSSDCDYGIVSMPMMGSAAAVKRPVKQAAQTKVHALTSIRFFAAFYVVIFHSKWGITPGSALDQFFSMGNASVCFFFLLSGYILALVYLREGQPVPKRKFYVARFARIYPLYFVSLVADTPFAVSFRAAQYGLKHAIERIAVLFAGSIVMQQMWIQASAGINGPAWSLCVEAVFYLSFPFYGQWLWKLNKRGVGIAAMLFYALEVAVSAAIYHRKNYHVQGLDLVSFVGIFGLGVLVARWQSLTTGLRPEDSGLNRKAWAVFVVASLGAVAVVCFAPWLTRMNLQPAFILEPVFMGWIWSLSVAPILPVRLLSARWLVVLGDASYGLYLIHLPVFHAFSKLHWTGSPWNYPLYLGTCIGLSVLSLYYLEAPARRMILNRFHSQTKETLEASSAAQ
jgi:peptidoglycan/LPS O-acetylase OafA/YrhL